MSRRTVRGVTPSRSARSAPDHSRWAWSRESRRSSRAEVSNMGPSLPALADSCVLKGSGLAVPRPRCVRRARPVGDPHRQIVVEGVVRADPAVPCGASPCARVGEDLLLVRDIVEYPGEPHRGRRPVRRAQPQVPQVRATAPALREPRVVEGEGERRRRPPSPAPCTPGPGPGGSGPRPPRRPASRPGPPPGTAARRPPSRRPPAGSPRPRRAATARQVRRLRLPCLVA